MKYLLFLLLPFLSLGQNSNATWQRLIKKFNQVKSYEVKATIKPQIRMLPVKATVQFNYPSTFKMKSAGISILPKNGFSELPLLFSQPNQFTAISSGVDQGTEVLTLLPTDNEADIVLAKIWVDTKDYVVTKSQITSRTKGTVICEFDYANERNLGLPSRMKFQIDIRKFKIPKGVATDINRTSRPAETGKTNPKGSIDIELSEYKIQRN
jgi:hypothetical protein